MSGKRKIFMMILAYFIRNVWTETLDTNETPEGYYAFIESRNAIPPKVKQPPYIQVQEECVNTDSKDVSIHNLCGDLNAGKIPRNPLKQNIMGEPYPELIRNHTLKFLSKALPALKADGSLPKVTEIFQEQILDGQYSNNRIKRQKRESSEKVEIENRQTKRFCEDGTGIFCTIYRAISGDSSKSENAAERRDETTAVRYDSPPTPCPARVEYVTPIYAKSYLGSWRYVVQIPYEGYFTQTIEVTKCLQVRCYYLDGGCLSTPRWVSLLVAEIFYPNSANTHTTSTTAAPVPPIHDFEEYQQYLQHRASNELTQTTEKTPEVALQCDGYDSIGCYQIRLYYDWFLIPGSCKCWKPDYFSKYLRKRPATPDL
ncbi:uncharacterized protein LOC134830193 isoform X2 [Culicoides brevitarsis]|uniref:uncharacterized protein LOC134830193 isoform X2 n=1 Tax=Culicoides brevitarsis TaxID=469753 RepID=UPI00307B965F